MFKHAIYNAIPMNWDTFTFPVKAGTPVGANGCLENSANCIGFVVENILAKPLMANCLICTGGNADLDAIEASFGEAISADAVLAINGSFNFNRGGNAITQPVGGGGGDAPYNVFPINFENIGGTPSYSFAGDEAEYSALYNKLKEDLTVPCLVMVRHLNNAGVPTLVYTMLARDISIGYDTVGEEEVEAVWITAVSYGKDDAEDPLDIYCSIDCYPNSVNIEVENRDS